MDKRLKLVDDHYDRLGNSLSHGVDLRSVTTTGDANTDINVGYSIVSPSNSGSSRLSHLRTELVRSKDQDRLVDLVTEDLGFDERKRLSVDLDETAALLAERDGGGSSFLAAVLLALSHPRGSCRPWKSPYH